MRTLALAALLVLPAGARAAKPKAAAKPAAEPGVALPLLPPATGAITLELISARFAELDGRMQSLRAGFKQFVRLEGSDTVQQVEGLVLFKKPDLMRLTHTLPETQTVVSDGEHLWVHRESTNQVIKTKLSEWRRSEPLAQGLLDFGRSAELLARYSAALSTVSAPGADGHRDFTLKLTPRPADRKGGDSDFELLLKASTRDFFPGDATLRVGRASIRSVFENVRLNPELSTDTFRFTAPPGADIFTTPAQKPEKKT